MPSSTLKPQPKPGDVPGARLETTVTMLAGLALLIGIYWFFSAQLYGGYLLIRDDPANIGGTMQGGLYGWLTKGMAGYYHVYPEWPQPGFSNFYRPAWNLIIFVEKTTFGSSYWIWFLVFCALQYFGAFLFLRVQRILGVPPRPALIFAMLFLFNPAFVNLGFVYPGFQFDVFVSLVLLAALHQLLEYRFGTALALITAAVFTKETAIFAPVAAAITVFILKRDPKWSVAMLAPLLVWVGARLLAYHAVMGGTFASPANSGELFSNIVKGLAVWPTGAVSGSFLAQTAGASNIALPAFQLVNAALWVILAYAAFQVAREFWRSPQKTESKLQAVLLVWTLGALTFCMLTRPQTRFGAIFYVFLLLFLACFLFAQARPGYLRLLPIFILSLVTLARGDDFLRHAITNGTLERRGETALFNGLRALPQDGRTVLVANAPTMLSAPVFLSKSWDLKLNVIFADQVHGCTHAKAGDVRYDLSTTSLLVGIPPCAYYVFAGVPEDIQSKLLVGDFRRPGIGVYGFPGHPIGKRASSGDIDFGRALQIRFERPPGTVLAYDWQGGAYRVLTSGSR